MDNIVKQSTAGRRFALSLFMVFAVVALTLAAAGVDGVLAATVAERTREIGIRSALGASHRATLFLVLRQTGVLAGTGLLLGLAGASLLSRYLGALLFGPGDLATFTAVTLLLRAVA